MFERTNSPSAAVQPQENAMKLCSSGNSETSPSPNLLAVFSQLTT